MSLKWNDILQVSFFTILSYLTLFFSYNSMIGEEAIAKWYAFALIPILCCVIVLYFTKNIEVKIDELTSLLFLFIFYLAIRSFVGMPLNTDILYFIAFITLFYIAKSFNHGFLPHIFIVGCVIQSVIGIMQYFGIWYSMFNGGMAGTFDNPAGYSSCLAITYPLCFLLLNKSKQERIFGIISMIVIIVGILLSASRSGIISVAVVSIVYGLASLKRAKLIYIGTSVVLLMMTVLSLLFFKTDSIYGRLLIWKTSLNLIKENLIFGGGPGSFRANYMSFQGDYFAKNPDSPFLQLGDNVFHPFNEYIELVADYGLVGFILFIALFVYVLMTKKKNDPYLLCLISLAIFSFFSYPLSYPFSLVIAAFCLGRLADVCPYWRFRANPYLRGVFFAITAGALLLFLFDNIRFKWRWNEVYNQSFLGIRDSLMVQYDSLYKISKGDTRFLYCYAVELEREGQPEKSIKIMKECRERLNNYDVNIFLGEVYLKNEEYDLAEEYYVTAKNMIPNRFLPLGRLLRVYIGQSEQEKAILIAKEIVDKEVKVSSAEVSRIIIEAREYLDKNSSF